jgi:7-cyano-7-deazaguanine reductase
MSNVSIPSISVLGSTVPASTEHVECFPAPPNVQVVRLSTDEVCSLCPVTNQPNLSSAVIEYEPGPLCVESQSLRSYLWGLRDRALFAEALAAEIAAEISATARPKRVKVTLTQRSRGGIEVQAVSELVGGRSSAGPVGHLR